MTTRRRSRRTTTTTRRRRTTRSVLGSHSPKGRQLEDGSQRAPRLVINISSLRPPINGPKKRKIIRILLHKSSQILPVNKNLKIPINYFLQQYRYTNIPIYQIYKYNLSIQLYACLTSVHIYMQAASPTYLSLDMRDIFLCLLL